MSYEYSGEKPSQMKTQSFIFLKIESFIYLKKLFMKLIYVFFSFKYDSYFFLSRFVFFLKIVIKVKNMFSLMTDYLQHVVLESKSNKKQIIYSCK